MDKYEYRIKAEQIRKLAEQEDFASAMKIANTIDWNRVRSIPMLCLVGEIYEKNNMLEESRDVMLIAYDRHPYGRMIIYSLAELSIRLEDYIDAVEYYKEFVQVAPRDTGRYILQYKLYEAQHVGIQERIAVLEEFKRHEYIEKWAFELAYLYHRAGMKEKCVAECDELILWFADGKYVEKAMELKMIYAPLTEEQQKKYDSRNDVEIEKSIAAVEAVAEKPKEEEPDIQVKTLNYGIYDTVNLQQELARSMQQILDVTQQEPKQGSKESIVSEPKVESIVETELHQDLHKTAKVHTDAVESEQVQSEALEVLEQIKDIGVPETEEVQADSTMPESVVLEQAQLGKTKIFNINAAPTKIIPVKEINEQLQLKEQISQPQEESETYPEEEENLEQVVSEAACEEIPQVTDIELSEEEEEQPEELVEEPEEETDELVEEPEETEEEPDELVEEPEETEEQPDELPEEETEESDELVEEEDTSQEPEDTTSQSEKEMLEKQATCQMNIEEVLKEWERMKAASSEKGDNEQDNMIEETMFETVTEELSEDMDSVETEEELPLVTEGIELESVEDEEELYYEELEEAEEVEAAQEEYYEELEEAEEEKAAQEEYYEESEEAEEAEAAQEEYYQQSPVVPVKSEIIENTMDFETLQEEEEEEEELSAIQYEEETAEEEYEVETEDSFDFEFGHLEDAIMREAEAALQAMGQEASPVATDTTVQEQFEEPEDEKAQEQYQEEETEDDEYSYWAGKYQDEPEKEEETLEETTEEIELELEESEDEGSEYETVTEEDFEAYREAESVYQQPAYKEVSEHSEEVEEEEVYEEAEEPEEEEAYEEAEEPEEEEAYEEAGELEEEEAYEEAEEPEEEEAYEEAGEPEEEEAYEEAEEPEKEEAYEETEAEYEVTEEPEEEEAYEEAEEPEEEEVYEEAEVEDEASEESVTEVSGEEENQQQPESEVSEEDDSLVREEIDAEDDGEQVKLGANEESFKKIFKYFTEIPGVSEQIIDCIGMIGEEPTNGNMIIMGDTATGKTTLAAEMIKLAKKCKKITVNKVARITGEAMNDKEVADIINSSVQGILIVEEAASMTADTVRKLDRVLEETDEKLLVILEDSRERMMLLLEMNLSFREKFPAVIDLPPYTNTDLVAFATSYATEKGCTIDEMGVLALYSKLAEMQFETDFVPTFYHVKELIDQAMEKAQKKKVKSTFGRFLSKKKEKDQGIVIREKDFM